ncbi:MAG: helix-turn-helix domain-containing protein [Bacillota bacterium]|nr:helix-turn-helix domain-containing protein [Bacillota bacterium]
MPKNLMRITLRAARINAGLSQEQVAQELTDYLGTKVSRQRISFFEKHLEETPVGWGEAFAKLYKWPSDAIKFTPTSTLSYTLRKKHEAS